jgi:cytochrome c
MKKTFLSIAVLAFFTYGITSCGGKQEKEKEGTEDEEYNEYGSAQNEESGQSQQSTEALIQQGQALVDASDCKACHHATNKIIGPPHAEVAKKYEFTKANVTYLAGKIINGGSGVWGEIPMTPHVDLSQADAEKMAMYVLSLDGEKPNF